MTPMDAIARGWLVRVASDHFWRVAHWYDFDDLLQDGHMVWWRIVHKYETETGRIRSRRHLMRLFKISFLNHLHQLANRKTRNAVECLIWDCDPVLELGHGHTNFNAADWDPWGSILFACDLADLDKCVIEAPLDLQVLLAKLLYEVQERIWRSLYRVRLDGTRETINSKLCRIADVDRDRDLRSELYDYLRS